MTDLIQWPETAKVDRIIPKERLYAEARAGAPLKQRFVEEVQRVRWAYKLGEESLRLAPGKIATEIQVFIIELKGSSLDNSVLVSIDKAIPSQIVFELRREDGIWAEQAMAAAYKRAGGKTKGTDYFRTGWIGTDQPRIQLPAALDMDELYSQLLGRLLPHPIRPAEQLSDALDRIGRARGLTREIAALEKKMHTEPQLNRKIELRKQIKERTAVLTELTDLLPSSKE
ncbi:DUF4391 domain-containing protein [Tessaracoccus sp. SD287]|uniref:DUF4391 domain-containing protein n=1 Tax=Tessaracoccus sp. SD287 TaxID=2782008 RepID=UPI001A97C2FD|nr:DUF4391 domain-containing protein [Tessaracoccus sp. SD287]MBO1031390.1 DUF4391 domain-containing protein [Tessaracoccus sp. SD287]